MEPDNKIHGNNMNVEIDENGDRKTRHIYIVVRREEEN